MKAWHLLAFLLVAGGAQAFQPISAAESTGRIDQIGYNNAASNGPVEDVRAIRELVSSYQEKVRQKDAHALLSFYLDEAVPVTGALAAKSYAVIVAANKQPIPRFTPMTAKVSVAGEVKQAPDRISNLIIQTDGAVGSVSYDYAMDRGHGRIDWSVIRTNDGWKIAAVVFSINIAAADKS